MVDWHGKSLKIGELNIRVPIVQGGMGIGISGKKLAAAVADQGGVGVISSVAIGHLGIPLIDEEVAALAKERKESRNISVLRQEIRAAKKMTTGVLGVNIMVAITEFAQTAKAAVEEGIDIIFAGAGLPLDLPESLKDEGKTKLVPIISSAKAAALIAKRWMKKYQYIPDAFVLEGPAAGGHLGFSKEQIEDPKFQLESLIPEVLKEIRRIEEETGKEIPLIAGGGVFTGEDIHRIMALGASAVQIGTRFVVTEECDADISFKETYINCTQDDIAIIESPVGLPGRAFMNKFLSQAKEGEQHPKSCPRHCITNCAGKEAPYCISSALINACIGKQDQGFAFIGANGWRVKEITTVKKLFEELSAEFNKAMSESSQSKRIVSTNL
ncbi:MAG: nitronate monooxygenase [Eubacteriales bacterium]|nr:nitronate monooxygenase [Eubacteriales bacterium]